MVPAVVAAIASVVVVVIATVGQLISSRNDRALAHQEVDLLKKLQPESKAAADLELIISTRIRSWRGRREASRVALKWSAGLVTTAYVAIALVTLLDFYVMPERAWDGVSALARTIEYGLIGIVAIALLGAAGLIVLSVRARVQEYRESRRQREEDSDTATHRSLPETAADGSPKPSPAHSPNGSAVRASATSPRGET
jgi:hypothetical protein